jgi:DNA-binding beta-propeller fold protein YncE
LVFTMRTSFLLIAGVWMGLALGSQAQDITHDGRLDACLVAPQRLAVAADGRVLVSEPAWKRVRLLAADGSLLASRGVPGALAVGFDPSGNPLVGHGDMVEALDAAGQPLYALGAGAGEFLAPSDLATAPDGRVYVTDRLANRVKVYGAGGAYLFQFGGEGAPGGLLQPTGIAWDAAQNRVLVADQGHARVVAYSPEGEPLATYGRYTDQVDGQWVFEGTFTRIQGLAVDGAGRIYVADAFQNNVQVLDGQGAFLAFVQAVEDGQTRFALPMDLAVDGERLLLAAGVASGVQRFQLDGATGLPEDPAAQPGLFTLESAYPNPFNGSTTLSYTLAQPAEVDLSVVNLAGQTVATLVQGPLPAGRHQSAWSTAARGDISSGFYVCRLQATGPDGESRLLTQKVLLLK